MRTKTPLQAEKILLAAARLFATHRFHEARMEDVAALAEVGKGTLYRYFQDKEELYLTLLRRAGEELSGRLAGVTARPLRPRARLEAVVAALIDYVDEHPHLFDLIQHAEVMQHPGQEFPWQQTRTETLGLVKGVFADGAAAGEFTVADPDLGVLMLLGGLRAVMRFGARPRPADLAGRVVAGFLEGAASCAPPRRARSRA